MLQYIKEASPFTWQTSMPACGTADRFLVPWSDSRIFAFVQSLPLINVHNCSAVQNKAVIPTKEGYAEHGCPDCYSTRAYQFSKPTPAFYKHSAKPFKPLLLFSYHSSIQLCSTARQIPLPIKKSGSE